MKLIQPLYYEGTILLDKNLTPLALLKRRIEQNYADFKAETLMSDAEDIFERAYRIAAVKDAYEQLTSDGDYLYDDEVTFLLGFYNPLEIVADYLQERQTGYPVEIDEALKELFNAGNHEENYLTIDFAEELRRKHGDDISIKIALRLETLDVAEKYLRLMKLTDLPDVFSPEADCKKPFKMFDFGKYGFFVFEDDGEGCF